MGTNVSTVINSTIITNSLSTAVNALQSIQQTNESATDVHQICNIHIDGKLSCASLEITQDAKVTMRSFSAATADQQLTMAQQVQQALEESAKTELEQKNKDLSVFQTNIATTVNSVIENTRQEQIVNMTQAFQQTVSLTSSATQEVVFTVGTEGEVFITGACQFAQTATIDYTATQVVEAGMEVITSQEAVQKAAIVWDTLIRQSNEGVNLALILGLVFGIAALGAIIFLAVWFSPKQRAKRAAKKKEMAMAKEHPIDKAPLPPQMG